MLGTVKAQFKPRWILECPYCGMRLRRPHAMARHLYLVHGIAQHNAQQQVRDACDLQAEIFTVEYFDLNKFC